MLEPQHLRAHATLDDGSTLLYTDIRRFGTWVVADAAGADAYLAARLGPEPLGDGFTPPCWRARSRSAGSP